MKELLILRPHHILDIIRNYGHFEKFTPHPYGHAQHRISEILVSNPNIKIKLINGSDDICTPCKHLLLNGFCNDVLHQLEVPVSKQEYNDSLDKKLFPYLNLKENSIITFKEFLKIVNNKTPGIEEICSHPKEDKNFRLEGLKKGLSKLL
ncbi:MAG: DUF1284 domain-containing protein [Prolixibacteraceae bacterium]|nr:DUF1284 domain-containing protein [Prolixibacteraceae bacterium]